ncbi:MAG: leucyl aminopeptidase [Candidatus Algichlamydia australiensis]|nr:leucyl aminopeptidase [Chlamydiales bacterium]
MKFSTSADLSKKCDLVIVPFFEGPKLGCKASLFSAKDLGPIKTKDFKGKEKEISLVYDGDKRYLLLGLGKGTSVRRCYAEAVGFCHKKKIKNIAALVPTKGSIYDLADGLLLANYAFDKYKKEKSVLLTSCLLVGGTKTHLKECEHAAKVMQGVYLARDLINGNADEVTPERLAKEATALAKKYTDVKTKVLNEAEIKKEKMGLFLAVAQSSRVRPRFIVCEYRGAPKSKEHTVVIGKGVTYDTGGLNLKPTGYMETMKADMSGSAAAIGLIKAAAEAKIKANVTCVVAATENAIDRDSYKPGDVFFGMNGTSVEIDNTDAEGRLTMADALAYSVRNLKPTRMIDMATLTGAIVVALGEERSGLFTENKSLEKALVEAGEATGEKVWPLPMDKEYRELLKSGVADIKNCGGRQAGSITAAIFLKEFVGKVPWAHLDIAGTAYLDSGKFLGTTPASGVGVRLLIRLLEGKR